MKKIIYFFLAMFLSLSASAQDVTGQWNGALKIQGVELHLVFHIQKSGEIYSATLDSPDQGAKGIPASFVTINNDSLTVEIKSIGGKYNGKIESDNKITGIFTQMGMKLPLDLEKGKTEEVKLVRPQEPAKPYPYYSEEVKFANKIDGDTLAGTLTLPQKAGIFPVVVMITGSGPQNRDEELMGHKPFLVIADYLTRNGIGVLRYDDRGTASSTGNFAKATTYDFSKDAESAVNYLLTRKDINKKKIGLMGHSEGGIIAPMIASRNKNVSFIVLLAGTGVRGDKLLAMQSEAIGRASGMSEKQLESAKKINQGVYEMIFNSKDTETLKSEMKVYLKKSMEEDPDDTKSMTTEQINAQVEMTSEQVASPWMQYFIKYDPAPTLKKVKIPVLALNGTKDLQVPSKENLPAIKASLEKGGNKKFKIVELPGLNHLFQECEKGTPSEYSKIEQTFSPRALDEILKWIKIQNDNF